MRKFCFCAIAVLLAFSVQAKTRPELLTFDSKNLGKVDSVLVFSPDNASLDTPALVLFHGRSGSCRDWSSRMDLQKLCQDFGFRIICPDGFKRSWYLDNLGEGTMKWRTFFWEELWPVLVEKYGMKPDRTFIDGLSMGGHGAMSIFLDHPDLFRGAGSMSGVLNLNHSGTAPKDIALACRMESIPADTLLAWSAVGRLGRLSEICGESAREKVLMVSCGSEDRRYVPTALEFSEVCRRMGYQYYLSISPGQHDWKFWPAEIPHHLDRFREALAPSKVSKACAEIKEDPSRAAGVYHLYEFDSIPAPTPAPKGFKLVYLSHYGRHGARYLEGHGHVDGVMNIMNRAHKSGMLTPFGEDLYSRLTVYAEEQTEGVGKLSTIGYAQHQRIARNMLSTYPELFKCHVEAEAMATAYDRCIQSMESFCGTLEESVRKLKVTKDSGPAYYDELNPHLKANPNFKGVGPDDTKFTRVDEWGTYTLPSFAAAVVPYRHIIERIFKSYDFVREWDEPVMFCYYLYAAVMDAYDIPTKVDLSDVLTPEERYALWRVDNFYMYNTFGPRRYQDIEALENIVRRADEDLASGKPELRLRFGHDTVVMSILWMLNAEHMGEKPSDAFHIEDNFQNYRITMAATLIFAFYRDKAGETIVKLTLNERELTLPDLEPVSGPYYRWEDVRNYCNGFISKPRFK